MKFNDTFCYFFGSNTNSINPIRRHVFFFFPLQVCNNTILNIGLCAPAKFLPGCNPKNT